MSVVISSGHLGAFPWPGVGSPSLSAWCCAGSLDPGKQRAVDLGGSLCVMGAVTMLPREPRETRFLLGVQEKKKRVLVRRLPLLLMTQLFTGLCEYCYLVTDLAQMPGLC